MENNYKVYIEEIKRVGSRFFCEVATINGDEDEKCREVIVTVEEIKEYVGDPVVFEEVGDSSETYEKSFYDYFYQLDILDIMVICTEIINKIEGRTEIKKKETLDDIYNSVDEQFKVLTDLFTKMKSSINEITTDYRNSRRNPK